MPIITQEPRSALIAADAQCPRCGNAIAPRLRLIVERIRTASKRPITPELLVVCSRCSQLLILSLRPAPLKTSAS